MKQSSSFLRSLVTVFLSVLQLAVFEIGGFDFSIPMAQAAIPSTIGYQGRLKNSSGTAQTGAFSFTFRLYASSTGGVALWSEIQPSISVDTGAFAVQLGSVTPFPTSLDFNTSLFLTTEVNGDGEMSPRIAINSVPYAYTAGGVNSFDATPSSATGGRMYYDTTNGSLNYYDGISGLWKSLSSASGSAFTALTWTNATGSTANITSLTFGSGTGTNLIWTNATGINTTSTNLFATNGTITNGVLTNGTASSLTFTNGTSTSWLGFATASGTSLNTLSGNILSLTAPTLVSSNASITGGSINGTPIGTATPSTGVFTSVTSTNATTTNLFFTTASGTGLFASSVQVNGSSVCLQSGVNCPIFNSTTETLATVTARGPSATTTLQLFGGFLSASSTVTSTFTVLGDSSLQNASFTNATATSVTTTNLAVSGHVSTDLLPSLDAALSLGSSALRWNGNFGTVTTTNLAAAVGAFTTLSATTGTITDLVVSTSTFGTVNVSQLLVNGQSVGNGVPATTATLQTVTNNGATTSNAITAYGGITVSDLTVTGTSDFQTVTFTNGTGTSVTTTNLFVENSNVTNSLTSLLTFTSGTSTSWLGFSVASGSTIFASSVAVNGSLVCLANGSNCPSGTVSDLQTVTNAGNTTTRALQFNGGTSTFDFLPSLDAALSLGSSALRWNGNFGSVTTTNLIATTGAFTTFSATTGTITTLNNATLNGTNATFTNVTSSNLAATTVSTSQLFVNGTQITTNGSLGVPATTATLQTITNNGATTSNAITAFGGITASNLTVTGTTELQDVIFTNATATNATTTNLFATNGILTNGTITNGTMTNGTISNLTFTAGTSTSWIGFATASGSNVFASSIQVNGSPVCLANGVNCPGSAATTATLQAVTDNGATTTHILYALGGIQTFDIDATGTLSVTGQASFGNVVETNVTSTNATTTNFFATNLNATNSLTSLLTFTSGTSTSWLGFSVASGSTIFASSVAVNGSLVCLQNGTNCPSGTVSDFQTVTNAGNTTTNAIVFNGGTSTADFFPSVDAVLSLGSTAFRWNGNFGSVTTTGLVASAGTITTLNNATLNGTNATFTNVTSSNATTTNLAATTVSTSELFVNGTQITTNGSSGVPATTATLQTVTNNGATTSNAITAYGGITVSDLTVTGTSDFQTVTFTNGTGTSVTTTNLFVANGSFSNGTISNLTFTNGTSTSWIGFATASGSNVFASSIQVNGSPVCLANGVNCLPAALSDWTYDPTNGFIRPATSTNDVVIGATASATAPFYFDVESPTSSLQIGRNGNANLFVGTSTYGGGLNSLFSVNGDDAFIQGNLGVASSVYTNGSFNVGASTVYASNSVTNESGDFTVSSTGDVYLEPVSGGHVRIGGSTTPASTLEVGSGDTPLVTPYTIALNTPGQAELGIRESSTGQEAMVGMGYYASELTLAIGTLSPTPMYLFSGGVANHNFRLGPNGNIGIGNGMNEALTRLEVVGAVSSTGMFAQYIVPQNNNTYDFGSVTGSWANIYASGTVFIGGDAVVNGSSVCLMNGANCPTGSLVWSDESTSNFIHPATATRDVVIGATASATAPFYFDVESPTSSLQIGRNGNANLFVGTSTYGGGLNSLFSVNGDDAFIQGNLGVASSVYTNGAFVAGGGSTFFGNGFITKTDGSLVVTSSDDILLTPDGNVGVGTSTPVEKLTVVGGNVLVEQTGIGAAFIMNRTDGIAGHLRSGVSGAFFGYENTGFFAITRETEADVLDGIGALGNAVLLADANGNVGIGVFATSSQAKLQVIGNVSSTALITGDVTSTNVTTTNLFASGVVSTTQLFVNGKKACLEDGTNCQVPSVKSASTTSNLTLTGTAQSIVSVTSTPRSATNQLWIVVAATYAADDGAQTISYSIRRGATCAAGTVVGATITDTMDDATGLTTTFVPGSKNVAISFVDSPATTTAVTYHLCASTSVGSPVSDSAQMTVEEVQPGADLGEVYYSDDTALTPGEVVAIAGTGEDKIRRATPGTGAIGVVSTRPGQLLSETPKNGGTPVIVGLAGRVPVKVSLEGGSIHAGDALTISSHPGLARKATEAGFMIGRALSDFVDDGAGEPAGVVMMFIQNGYFMPSVSVDELSQLGGSEVVPSAPTVLVAEPTEFQGDVSVVKHFYEGSDAAGYAKLLMGARTVDVTFREKYLYPPIVTATPMGEVPGTFWIERSSEEGFTIRLSQEIGERDTVFSWAVTAIKEPMLYVSDGTHGKLQDEAMWRGQMAAPPDALESVPPMVDDASSSTEEAVRQISTGEESLIIDENVSTEP